MLGRTWDRIGKIPWIGSRPDVAGTVRSTRVAIDQGGRLECNLFEMGRVYEYEYE